MELPNGKSGGAISLKEAKNWTKNYRDEAASTPEEKVRKKARAHYFDREVIDQILVQPGCAGIRMYYALNDEKEQQLILVGVNADGKDQLPEEMDDKMATEQLQTRSLKPAHIVADRSATCPNKCDEGSALN